MTDEQPEKGTKENPYTREDVLKAIKEHGGTAKGLDLSGKIFKHGIDLSNLDLGGIILKEARLWDANLEESKLPEADLRKADLAEVNLQRANLFKANFEEASLLGINLERAWLANANLERARLSDSSIDGADLYRANLKGANLANTSLSYDSKLWKVDWGNYVLGEERSEDDFYFAEETYRKLKTWYTNAGMYDIAGKFFYREMEVKRKTLKWWPNPFPRAWSKFISLICGYGERPLRVIGWAASVVLGLAFIYFIAGSAWEWWAFWNSLYFSAVSFTALGYGKWALEPIGWVKGLGAFEAFIGVFTMALFLITFIRKMTR